MANDSFGRIALHFAAAAGNYEAMNTLIHSYSVMLAQHGITAEHDEWQGYIGQFVEAATIGGDTPLMKAAASWNPAAVELLLFYSSKPFAVNRQGKDARAFAHNREIKLYLQNHHDALLMQQNGELPSESLSVTNHGSTN